MASFKRCDNCGKEQREPYRMSWDEREQNYRDNPDRVLIVLEHNEDDQNFDACSWACVAEIALRQSAANTVETLEEENHGE